MIHEIMMISTQSLFNLACGDLNNAFETQAWKFVIAWPAYKLPSGRILRMVHSHKEGKTVELHFDNPWGESWIRADVVRKLEVVENWTLIMATFEEAQKKEYERLRAATQFILDTVATQEGERPQENNGGKDAAAQETSTQGSQEVVEVQVDGAPGEDPAAG